MISDELRAVQVVAVAAKNAQVADEDVQILLERFPSLLAPFSLRHKLQCVTSPAAAGEVAPD